MNGEQIIQFAAIAALAALAEEDEIDNRGELTGQPCYRCMIADGRVRRKKDPVIRVDQNAFRVLPDPHFKEHFRMDRHLFEKLLVILGNYMTARGYIHRRRTGLDLKLMMTLWILATGDTFRSVSVKFGVPSRSTVHHHYKLIIRSISEMAPLFIQWPNCFERDNIRHNFERKWGYPGCVGCVDGTHIYISAPLIQAQRYVNRFSKFSILLQAVCDDRGVFRDIYVGEPGSVNDARMFQRSPLSRQLLHYPNMLSAEEHILGDGAYMLTDKLITPYRDNGLLNRRKRRHNYKHASARSCIERAFGFLKGVWRRQKLMLVFSPRHLVNAVTTCCVLANFIKLQGEPYEYPDPVNHGVAADVRMDEHNHSDGDDSDPDDPGQALNEGPANNFGPNNLEAIGPLQDPVLNEARRAGIQKRDAIADSIYPYDE